MRTKSTFDSYSLLLVIVTATALFCSPSWAKTKKFSRPDPTSADSQASPSATPAPGDTKAEAAKTDKKVDITDLENRYWTAKDTEFSVVQNRLYTKAKKFSLTPMFGTVLTDPYTNSFNLGLAINYYFSERNGVELQGWKTSAADADFITTFQAKGVSPDHNIPQGYIGASYNWIPIYAKLSLLEKKILYFDMSISPGLGVTFMQADTFAVPSTTLGTFTPNATNQAAVTLAIDVAQQVFITEHWAIRADLRNHIYQENIYGASSGNQTRTKVTYYGSFMLGVTFFQ